MKKNIGKTFTVCSVLLMLASCASNKPAKNTEADVYESEEDRTEVISSKKTEKSDKSKSLTSGDNPLALDKNAFQEFITIGNKDDYLKFDEFSLFTRELTGIKEKQASAVIRRDNLLAGWGSYYMAAYYFVQLDEENRAVLEKAAKAYFSDFENKRLQRKGKNTNKIYGKINYRIDWGTIASSTPNYGSGSGYVGYEFVKGSPYFTISNYPFQNDYYERAGDATTRESMQLKYYFTRAQLSKLLKLLSQENLNNEILGNQKKVITPSIVDEY